MNKVSRGIVNGIMKVFCRVYTVRFGRWLHDKRKALYSMRIRQYLGQVGEKTQFEPPVFLQGEGERRIRIGSNCGLGHHTVLGCWTKYGEDQQFEPEIIIGNDCSIGDYCHITAIGRVTIGDGLLTGRYVYIGDNAHGGLSWEEADVPPEKRRLVSKGEIKIGRNVWIGDKATILSGVTIGDNVIIGANSVVTHDIPSNSLATGVPATVKKTLQKE